MKKNIFNILLTAGVVLGMASCQKSVIAPLEGMFDAPVKVEATNITSSVVKGEKLRTFNFELTAGTDKANFALVGSTYFLPVNTYMGAAEAEAKNGSFIFGKTTVNGKAVNDGSVIVTKTGDSKEYKPEDVYTFDAMLFLEDGSAYNVVWSGKLLFEEEAVVYTDLKNCASATSNVANGTNSVTINLATDGLTATPGMMGVTWGGSGNYLALDVYSADGKLAPGKYTACAAGGTIAAGEFGIGWDPGDLWNIGMVFTNWGTCWWTVKDGVSTAEKVVDGTLNVALDGETYTITLESSTINAKYVGKINL